MRCFYHVGVPEVGGAVALSAEEAEHAVRVLRVRPGDPVALLDGAGVRATGCVEAVEGTGRRKYGVWVQIKTREVVSTPEVAVSLYVAPPRARLMGTLVHQAVELGVARICPVACARGVAKPDGSGDVWQGEAVAGMKQSGNPWLPERLPLRDFDTCLEESRSMTGFFGHVDGKPAGLGLENGGKCDRMCLWIGPEGGFTEQEVQAMLDAGLTPVRIGRWILRIETAVTALLGWLNAGLANRL